MFYTVIYFIVFTHLLGFILSLPLYLIGFFLVLVIQNRVVTWKPIVIIVTNKIVTE